MKQLSLFDSDKETVKITKPIRLIELFAGYGSQAMAMKRLGVNFETYRMIEFDKYAVNSYNAVHNTQYEPTDITEIRGSYLGIIDTEKYEYIMKCKRLRYSSKPKPLLYVFFFRRCHI